MSENFSDIFKYSLIMISLWAAATVFFHLYARIAINLVQQGRFHISYNVIILVSVRLFTGHNVYISGAAVASG